MAPSGFGEGYVVRCCVRRTELHFRSLTLCRRGWRPQEPLATLLPGIRPCWDPGVRDPGQIRRAQRVGPLP